MPVSLQIPQTVKVAVEAYSATDLSEMLNFPCKKQVQNLNGNLADVPREQFLTYMQFRARDVLSIDDIRASIAAKEVLLRGFLVVNGGLLYAHPNLNPQHSRPEAEELGEALGLSILDYILGTNEMDWSRIGESASKTLDFVASDGQYCYELETKGSIVANSSGKSQSIYQHKTGQSGIDAKKDQLDSQYGTAFRFGTISAVGQHIGHGPALWLVDPPVAIEDRNALDFKTLSRLKFLHQWIATISLRSSVSVALANRIAMLETVTSIEDQSGVSLRSGSGEKIDLSTDNVFVPNRFFTNKSVVVGGDAGGHVVPIDDDWLYFVGIRKDLLDLAIEQDFSTIRAYNRSPSSVESNVNAVFPRGIFQRTYHFNESSSSVRKQGKNHFSVALKGLVHYSAGGLAFGWLRKPSDL